VSARIVVGIAGGSGSGKTTLARRVLSHLPAGTAIRISHDAYYRDLSHLPFQERAAWNFDHPDALESELLSRHLDELRSGQPIHCPEYDFGTHTRKAGGVYLSPAPVVLVDGVLVLAVREIRAKLDLGVFVETQSRERLHRRIRRDTRDRGRTRHSVLHQWDSSVEPMFETFVAPSRAHADLIVPKGGFDPAGVQRIVDRIRSRLESLTP
jgi:uridine kinase